MNLNRSYLKQLLVLCSAVAATAAFGQTTRVWDAGDGTGVYLGGATNWVGDVLPATTSGTVGDFATWDNVVAGNLVLTYNGGIAGGFQSSGVNLILTPNQIGSVTIISPVAGSANLAGGQFWTNNASAASLQLGDGTANVLNLIWRSLETGAPYGPHYLINNSAAPNIIRPNVRFQAGGGNPHTLIFGGSGDWHITNNLTTANGVATTIGKTGAGTLIWAGPSISAALGNSIISTPLDFEEGRVILSAGNPLNTQRITNNATLQYDSVASQTLSGPINGTGNLIVSSGTLTLSGASTYTGLTVLTNTGTLVLGSAHTAGTSGPIGIGGTIFSYGGTLQFSAANTFDYSSRFATANNQAFKFDTAGQGVTFATGLTSSGGTLTKAGSGTLTLVGTSAYTGLTTVSAGKLVFQGAKSGAGDITVANSAALGVTDVGAQATPGTLALGTTAGVTLEFNNISSTTTAPLAAGALTSGGTVTVNVNSGSFVIGSSYPLLTWTTGSAPIFSLATLTGAGGNLSVSGNTLYLNITSLAFVWTGLTDGNWDISTLNNWKVNGVAQVFANGGTALFDDTVPSANTSVTLNSPVSPASVTVNSSAKTYSLTASGANVITGSGTLTKNGNSTLTLAGGINTYSGGTVVSGGTLTVGVLANGGSASDIGQSGSAAANLLLNGGTLQYTGPAAGIDRLFTVGTAGGTIDASGSGALTLNNSGSVALSGSGARAFTLKGTSADDNTLAAALADNGGSTSLAKSGAGKWIVSGNNTYSGGTTIAAGTLQVGTGGATGSLGSGNVTDNGTLSFNRSGLLTNGVISGTGSVTVDGGGTLVLPGDNTYTAGTTINTGTLQVGTGGATGSLNSGSTIVNNGTLVYDSTTAFSQAGIISGTGNLIKRGSGLLKILGANTYTGWTFIDTGATLQITEGNQGQFAGAVVTNEGTLMMTRQDTDVFIYSGSIVGTGQVWKDNNNINTGDVTLTGPNTYSGGTVIGGGGINVGDGAINGWILGNVFFTNSLSPNENPRRLTFNRSDDVTFPGNITYSTNLAFGNRGIVVQRGTGTLTLTGNNTYPGGTIISNGVLQVGNGGTSGAIGTGPCTVNTTLVFNRSDNLAYGGVISGAGSVVKTGAGTLTLTATNTYFGSMTVSNGNLLINGQDFPSTLNVYGGGLGGTGIISGPVTLDVGTTLVPGAAASTVGVLTITSDLTIGGNVAVDVNKSLTQSNDLVVVSGALSKTGTGTLTVANLGTALAVGDKFTLFSQPVANGSALTVTGAGATWSNQLEVDGSITALTVGPAVNPLSPTLQVSVSGSSLTLGWPTNLGWTLQTNSVGLASAGQWFPYPGSAALTNVNLTINPANSNVFFRMVYTNTP